RRRARRGAVDLDATNRRGGLVAGLVADRRAGREAATLARDRAVGGAASVARDTREGIAAGPVHRHVAAVPAIGVGVGGGGTGQRGPGLVDVDAADGRARAIAGRVDRRAAGALVRALAKRL